MSEKAAYMLQDLIEQDDDEIPIKVLKPKLIIRESSIIKQ
jgi:DNA-binding LacI/PurR family transcriptional regulator